MCKFRIASVIVTYNRKELLKKNIDSVLKQSIFTDIIIIDNNSSDGTSELVNEEYYNEKERIYFYRLEDNVGGAGGFSKGVDIAYKLGYDLIWLMDDDGRPYDNKTLEEILKVCKKVYSNKKNFIINSLVLCNSTELSFGLGNINTKKEAQKFSSDNIIFDKINPFNGTMISKELVEEIGLPNDQFFIKGDEAEYYLRAKKSGAYIATCTNSLYYHPSIKKTYKKILGKNIEMTNEVGWKEYYRSRNYVYINKKYNGKISVIKFIIIRFINIIFYRDKKISKIKFSLKGLIDGLLNKMGRKVLP